MSDDKLTYVSRMPAKKSTKRNTPKRGAKAPIDIKGDTEDMSDDVVTQEAPTREGAKEQNVPTHVYATVEVDNSKEVPTAKRVKLTTTTPALVMLPMSALKWAPRNFKKDIESCFSKKKDLTGYINFEVRLIWWNLKGMNKAQLTQFVQGGCG